MNARMAEPYLGLYVTHESVCFGWSPCACPDSIVFTELLLVLRGVVEQSREVSLVVDETDVLFERVAFGVRRAVRARCKFSAC